MSVAIGGCKDAGETHDIERGKAVWIRSRHWHYGRDSRAEVRDERVVRERVVGRGGRASAISSCCPCMARDTYRSRDRELTEDHRGGGQGKESELLEHFKSAVGRLRS